MTLSPESCRLSYRFGVAGRAERAGADWNDAMNGGGERRDASTRNAAQRVRGFGVAGYDTP
jgi:hypothetical protein